MPAAVSPRAWWLVADVVAVVVFAAIGRASHAEDVAGTAATAAPFLVGAAAGMLVARSWRDPVTWRAGLLTWIGAVAIGLLLRVAGGDRPPPAFVLVATLSLAVLLLGWRLVVRLVVRAVARLRTRGGRAVTGR